MNKTFNFLLACLFCFSLTLLTGCGGGVPSLTPAEQAEVDEYKHYGRAALAAYLADGGFNSSETDGQLALKYVKYFVSQGADVNAKVNIGSIDRFGRINMFDGTREVTPLHLAMGFENIEIAKFLVSKGADVNAKDSYFRDYMTNWTPLHYAAMNPNVEFAKFLVSKGADINAKGYLDRTPLDVANDINIWDGFRQGPPQRNTAVAQYLESIGAKSGK